jgi:hypothetical protein
LSCVRVPVLSVQSTSIAPKFWMALSCLTMTFCLESATAPMARVPETIIGSISGVRPTAMASAKKNASFQSCLSVPLMRKTMIVITTMKRMSRRLTPRMPFSKLVGARLPTTLRAMPPRYVLSPVQRTMAVAVPLTTFVPWNARLSISKGLAEGRWTAAAVFSTGSDSPVSTACVTKRSFAESRRTSAGIMSPAESFTMSPGTRSRMGTSRSLAAAFSR